jgi:hypothetical protein
MSRGHTRVQEAYELLRAERVAEGESATTVLGSAWRLRDALLVKDHVGLIHLMARLPEDRERFDVPLGRLLRAAWVETIEDGGRRDWLDVVCTDARLLRTFLSLIGEMLDRSDESGRPSIDELAEVLESWRAALARERTAMDRNRLVGLFGELTVLERLAERDPWAALSSWKGRQGAAHDFSRSNALEVKTLLGDGSPAVTIHGEQQLDPPSGGGLHLVAFRIADSADGESIEELTARIAEHGVPHDEILRTLGDDAPGAEDRRRRFVIEDVRLHAVTDDFPGLRSSRLSPETMRGVSNISYQLSLDACPGQLDPELLDTVLENL